MALRCVCSRFMKREGSDYWCSKCAERYIEVVEQNGVWYSGTDSKIYIADNNKLIQKPKEEVKMSFFNYNPNEAGSGFDPVPAGDYEVIISEAKVDTFSSGNRGIKVTLTIRDDVDQEGGKRKVFENFIETPKAMFKFHNLAKGLEWAEGEGAATLEDFASKIQYQAVRVKLKVTAATGQYAAKNEVVTYLPTQAAAHSGGGFSGDPFQDDGTPIDISDDDLPF